MASILTNNSAMVALQTLNGINKNLDGIQSQISTGKKVGNAKDNAAVWAISSVMQSDVVVSVSWLQPFLVRHLSQLRLSPAIDISVY